MWQQQQCQKNNDLCFARHKKNMGSEFYTVFHSWLQLYLCILVIYWKMELKDINYNSSSDYIWLNQLSNTTNLWWIDVYYIVINYMFRRLWPSSGWWINKKTHKQLHLACVFYMEDGGTRSRVYWVGMGCIWVCIMLT